MKKSKLSWIGFFVGSALIIIALVAFGKTLWKYDFHQVVANLKVIPYSSILLSTLCVVMSYLLQTGYDYVGARSLNLKIKAYQISFTAFIANAITNNIGFAMLTSTGLRYRFYSAYGATTLEIAQLVVLTKIAFINGLFVFTGIMFLANSISFPAQLHLKFSSPLIGLGLLIPTLSLFIWSILSKNGFFKIGKYQIQVPNVKVLIWQVVFSCLQFGLGGLALYFLLPETELIHAGWHAPFNFLSLFMLIKFIAFFFPVPGGLGVLEGTALMVLSPAISAYSVLGGMVAYRLLTYLLPFVVAMLFLVGYELSSKQGLKAKVMRKHL